MYPLSVRVGDHGAFVIAPELILPDESIPGIPYSRQASSACGHLTYRLSLVECPHCGKPIRISDDQRTTDNGQRSTSVPPAAVGVTSS